MVEAVNGFGSGVAGLSVHTHTHTPPLLTSLTQAIPLSQRFCLFLLTHRLLEVLVSCRHFLGSKTVLKAHALQFRVLPVAVHLHTLPICLLIVFTHRNYPGFCPRGFLLWICEWCGRNLSSRVELWALHCCSSCTGQKTVNSFPAWSV